MKFFFLCSCIITGLLFSACTTHSFSTYNTVGTGTPDNLIYTAIGNSRVTCKKKSNWCDKEIYDCLLYEALRVHNANTIIDVHVHKYDGKNYSTPLCYGSALPAKLGVYTPNKTNESKESKSNINMQHTPDMLMRNIMRNTPTDEVSVDEIYKNIKGMNSYIDTTDGRFKF